MVLFILISTILLFFCLYFCYEIKNLKQKQESLELELLKILDRKLTINKDIISMENISNDEKTVPEEDVVPEEKNESLEEKDVITTIKEEKEKKYIARTNEKEELTLKCQNPTETSLKQEVSSSTSNSPILDITPNISLAQDFNPIEFVKKDKDTISIEQKKDVTTKEIKDNEYLKEISKQIEQELNPKTIDLTEYEKKQEEQAIISYKELLNRKASDYQQNSKENTRTLIEELKKLRDSLM